MSQLEDRSEQLFLFYRLAEMRQWSRVTEVGPELLAADPENAELHETMAQALINLLRLPEARRHAEKAIQLNPESCQAIFFLSIVEDAEKKHKKAQKTIEQAIQMAPNCAVYWEQSARYAYNAKDYKKAKEQVTRAAQLNPVDADIINLDIMIDEAIDEYNMIPSQDYIRRFERALELEPENVYCLNNLGVRYLDGLKDPKTAEVYFRRALAIDPHMKESRNNVLTAIRQQDPLFRVLYFPLDKMMMPILRLFQICWAKKWPILLLLFGGKYLFALGAVIFAAWAIFFYPLIYVYRWMTLIDLRRKSGDLSLRIPEIIRPFFQLSRLIRISCFFGFWLLFWTSIAVAYSQGMSLESFQIIVVLGVAVFLSIFWIRQVLEKRKTQQI